MIFSKEQTRRRYIKLMGWLSALDFSVWQGLQRNVLIASSPRGPAAGLLEALLELFYRRLRDRPTVATQLLAWQTRRTKLSHSAGIARTAGHALSWSSLGTDQGQHDWHGCFITEHFRITSFSPRLKQEAL